MKLSRSVFYVLGVATAVVVVAGCSGAGTPTSASPGAAVSAVRSLVVHRGVPYIPSALYHPGATRRSIRAAYATDTPLLFEADQDLKAINVYQVSALGSNPAPIGSITVGAGCPYGMAMDKAGDLFEVNNCGGNDVEEYPKGSTTRSQTITNGISNPLGAAIDSSGTLYVSNFPASITEYPSGKTTPSKTITGGGLSDPFGLALDKSGNLYIADFGAEKVFELPAGSTTVKALNLQDLVEPLGVAINTKTSELWVTDGDGDKVNVYKLGTTTPSQTITGFTFPYGVNIDDRRRPKHIRGEAVVSDTDAKDIQAFLPGVYTPYATLTNGVELPTGVLIRKP